MTVIKSEDEMYNLPRILFCLQDSKIEAAKNDFNGYKMTKGRTSKLLEQIRQRKTSSLH
jgi:hypothetical protein